MLQYKSHLLIPASGKHLCKSSSIMAIIVNFLQILALLPFAFGAGPRFAPYYDTFLRDRSDLAEIAQLTGQHHYHLAFALGGHEGCKPMWGAEFQIDDPMIMNPIKAVQAMGGEMIVATGGALGPYLEHLCTNVADLAAAYKTVLDVVGTNHLDVDVEAPVNLDVMNGALKMVQDERPDTTVSFTLMVQGEDYGLTPALGVDVLNHAVRTGLRVDTVNAMVMEFGCASPDFGDCIINTAGAILRQMKEIWPNKTDAELRSMLGLTPMLGRNFNGNTFNLQHAQKVVDWSKQNGIALLAFWSIERDNGGCSGTVSPYCSGIDQQRFDFTKIFQNF